MIRAQGGHGRRSRPGRGLSLDRIVTVTLELMDEQGIGAASMRGVSSRLGVRSMSLYRYVRDRDDPVQRQTTTRPATTLVPALCSYHRNLTS